jgi:riboflavin-specific deaminase-like protein
LKTKPKTENLKTEPPALPFVMVNMAMTADGKIATANRVVSSFGSARDHDHLLELRATADAVMAGARTVDLNPINLGPGPAKFRRRRTQSGLAEYNLRIIISGSGTLNPNAEVFKHRFSPIIILTTERATKTQLRRLRAVADEVRVCGHSEINFSAALRWLHAHWKVNRLLCEGGGELNDALFRAGLVNELHLTVCPNIFGGHRAPTIADGLGAACLALATSLELTSARRTGDEMFLVYRVSASRPKPVSGK